MSDKIIFGISTGNGVITVKGRPAIDEFELASALHTLLEQASENADLGDGALKGATIEEPHLVQSMNFRSENIEVTIGSRHFRIRVTAEPS